MAHQSLWMPTAFGVCVTSGQILTRKQSPSLTCSARRAPADPRTDPRTPPAPICSASVLLTRVAAVAAAASVLVASVDPSLAVSGGGKDFASRDWSGQEFHGDYTEKDFTTGLFRGCDFNGAILRGARMFKAELSNADLTAADMTGTSIEGAVLRDAVLKNAVLQSAYISDTIVYAADITGADFTDALISPEITISKLCTRPDATGTNPKTGASTRESLMCPD